MASPAAPHPTANAAPVRASANNLHTWLAAVLAVLVLPMIPAAIAVVFGRLARREGHAFAVIPVVFGVVAPGYMVVSLAALPGQIIF